MKKKLLAVVLAVTCAIGMSACSSSNNQQTSDTTAVDAQVIDEFNIAFAPYDASETMLAETEPLKGLLQEKLLEKGYDVKDINLTVGASYEAVGEALSAGTADAGFISGGTYVLYDEDCDVLLTALRAAYSKDSDNPADWNDGTEGKYTDEMSKYYKSIIIAGPSAKGQELAAKVNNGEELTWDDLNSATWSVMSASSASGYIYPSLWLYDNYGKTISDLSNVVQADSYSTSIARLASEQADIMVGFAHMQYKYADQWTSEFGRTEPIWTETNILGVTKGIYNDTICVSKASPIMTDEFKQAFGEAMIEIGETDTGLEIIDKTFSHKGYEWADSSDYDGEREAEKLIVNAE